MLATFRERWKLSSLAREWKKKRERGVYTRVSTKNFFSLVCVCVYVWVGGCLSASVIYRAAITQFKRLCPGTEDLFSEPERAIHRRACTYDITNDDAGSNRPLVVLSFNICKAMRVSGIFSCAAATAKRRIAAGNWIFYTGGRDESLSPARSRPHPIPQSCPKLGPRVKRGISIFAPFMPIIARNWNRSRGKPTCVCVCVCTGAVGKR